MLYFLSHFAEQILEHVNWRGCVLKCELCQFMLFVICIFLTPSPPPTYLETTTALQKITLASFHKVVCRFVHVTLNEYFVCAWH